MKIIVLDGYALNPGDLDFSPIENLATSFTCYERTSPNEVTERIKDADIILTNKVSIRENELEHAKKLKHIAVMATGYNIIDVEAANKRNISVSNVPAYSTPSVVQFVFALLFSLTNRVELHSESVFNGKWQKSKDFAYTLTPQIEITNKTFGIIGFGDIGSCVAKIAENFGMKVLVYSRTKKPQFETDKLKFVDFQILLKKSDFVSIHCPLNTYTRGLFNKDAFLQMKRSAFLINTSRGPIVVEEDLKNALNQDIIKGAALDVVSREPIVKNNPLLSAKNCIITPHIAWATKESRSRMIKILTSNIQNFQNNTPINIVN